MVRKAEKLGVAVATDEGEMDFLVQTHAENMMEVGGRPKNAAFFGLVARRFKHGPEYRIYVARIDGRPVAAVLLFYYNGTVEYFTPVVRKEYRETQALSLAIYRAMCDASIAGFRWWNWGGTWSSQEGVYRFKKRWGTQDRPYTYFVRLNDESLRRLKAQALLDAYPDFFVLPFSQLETPMEAH